MTEDPRRPRIVSRAPAPDTTAPAGTTEFSIGFDRPMCRRRGQCRLAWSRLRLHTSNVTMNKFAWSLRDPELSWNDAATLLSLRLPAPLCEGFRVRVEWTDLADDHHGLPPVPDDREHGASYVAILAAERATPAPPILTSMPVDGSEDVRRDLTIELYPDQPLAAFDADVIRVSVDGQRIPHHLNTNRNPPDWIYVHLEQPLPANADVRVDIAAGAVRSTLGAGLAEPYVLRLRTGDAPVCPAVPEPAWTEPPDGFVDHALDRFEAALRFRGWPVLDAKRRLHQRIELVEAATGTTLPVHVDLDPTPAHYRTIFVSGGREFAGLAPETDYALRWDGLAWPGFGADVPGEIRFRTAASNAAASFVAGCPHVSIVSTEAGCHLQAVVQAYAPAGIASARVVMNDGSGFACDMDVMESPNFRDMVSADARTTPPVLLSTMGSAPVLPDVDTPQTRDLEIHLTDGNGRKRVLPGLGFDMTRHAVDSVDIDSGPRPRARWTRRAPCDAHHIAILSGDGTPMYGGLFGADVSEFELPAGWELPPGRYLFQMWLLRATREDDLWDFAVIDRWITVDAEP